MRSNIVSEVRKIFPKIILITISVILSLFIAELDCRFYYFGNLSLVTNTPESRFIRYDEQLGWTNILNSEGYFSNPKEGYIGYVKSDENGVRANDNNINTEGDVILIIGDSVTVCLEVDNIVTYPAVLERLLYENGCEHRVYNVGVRGYWTDQALWNLERLIDIVEPKYVIYMLTKNDFFDNRTIKQSNRKLGKPVFLINNDEIYLINRPAKKFEIPYYAFVEYGPEGYEITEGRINEKFRSVMEFIKNSLALYYPLQTVYEHLKISPTASIAKNIAYRDLEVLELILQKMKRDDIALFLTSFPYMGEELYIDDLVKISEKVEIEYLNIFPYFTEETGTYHWKNDGHWNEKGHLQAATALYELLRPDLCGE